MQGISWKPPEAPPCRSPSTLAQSSRSTTSWIIFSTSGTPKPPHKLPSLEEPIHPPANRNTPLLRLPPWTHLSPAKPGSSPCTVSQQPA
ncbi:hypothetical protein ILYODFUR_017175 [Ilyodon furcidens]|uniref:Uncharacterized protein n=1 Tax=Ilyodon furcidens TaxID=33524 RepID=A0ABV0UGV2_9TELE